MPLLATALGLSLLGSCGGLLVASSLLLFTQRIRTRRRPAAPLLDEIDDPAGPLVVGGEKVGLEHRAGDEPVVIAPAVPAHLQQAVRFGLHRQERHPSIVERRGFHRVQYILAIRGGLGDDVVGLGMVDPFEGRADLGHPSAHQALPR